MTTNEQHRQVEIARELEAAARTLAHSTRTIPNPVDSYELLAELGRPSTTKNDSHLPCHATE